MHCIEYRQRRILHFLGVYFGASNFYRLDAGEVAPSMYLSPTVKMGMLGHPNAH
jgi:hypothetical protein